MAWSNYHTHSHFCDGEGAPEEYVKEAIARGMYALGFSGHSPVPFHNIWNIQPERLEEYLQTVRDLKKKYEGQIKLYVSLEIDYIDAVQGIDNFRKYDLDYYFAGVHFIRQYADGSYWNFDTDSHEFSKGVNEIFGGDIQKAVETYYYDYKNMIIQGKPNLLSHLDLIKKFNKNDYFFSEDAPWYRKIVLETLDIVKESGAIMEINTRGVFRKLDKEYYPGNWIIKEALKMNIPVTINADAHHCKQVTSFHEEVAELLLNTGFTHIHILDEQGWHPVKFDKFGIKI